MTRCIGGVFKFKRLQSDRESTGRRSCACAPGATGNLERASNKKGSRDRYTSGCLGLVMENRLNGVFEFLARLEFYYVRGLDLNGFTSLRITAFTGFTPGFLKSAKPHQGDFAVFFL